MDHDEFVQMARMKRLFETFSSAEDLKKWIYLVS